MKLLPILVAAFTFSIPLHAQDINSSSPPNPAVAAKPDDPFLKGKGDPASPRPRVRVLDDTNVMNYRFMFERYSVNKEDYVAMRDALTDESARYAKINEWVKAGKARLEDISAATGKSGMRFTIEAIHEFRYPTEFDAPAANGNPRPVGWDTRNIGETVEAEFFSSDDKGGGDLEYALQNVTFLGYDECAAEPGNPASTNIQPRFQTRKVNSHRALRFGQPALLAVMPQLDTSEKPSPGELLLRYVHVEAVVASTSNASDGNQPANTLGLHLEYTFYNLDRAAARDLIIANKDHQKIYAALQLLVGNKKAEVDSTATVITKSGITATVEAINEVRYGTETRFVVKDAPAKPRTEPPFFTSYETRNTGMTVEVEPTLGPDGLTVDLVHAPQFVLHVPEEKPVGIAAKYPMQPHFETSKMSNHMTCRIGEPAFAGTFNHVGATGVPGRPDSDRVRLCFLKIRNELAQGKP